MSVAITGLGWATSLGTGLNEVWDRILRGDRTRPAEAVNPRTGRKYSYFAVPTESVEEVGRTRRLRRSSAITYFTATAGLAALADAGLAVTPKLGTRTAVVFTVSSGGVIYTRRFYQQIVEEGANAASPLLFPETVYNAPASHLAAILGLDGVSYTLVGDGSVGLTGIDFAAHLLEIDAGIDQVVVVGGEEVDWILCAAYRDWRLTTVGDSMELYRDPPRGTVLGEGAAAVVLSRTGGIELEASHEGAPFYSRSTASDALGRVVEELRIAGPVDSVVGSANGTFVDAAERTAIRKALGAANVWSPKPFFGEALGAGALMQVVAAGLALRLGRAIGGAEPDRRVLVTAVGLNQQACGLVLSTE